MHFVPTMRPYTLILWVLSIVARDVAGSCDGSLCSAGNFQMVGRVVFGEARGESTEGQLAVAYTIVNRVSHAGYPNNLYSVVHQTYGSGIYQYNTLSDPHHTTQWEEAKRMNTPEYRNAIKAAEDALCCRVSDPTTCATDYCAHDPCSATSSNRYWRATNKMHIGQIGRAHV